MTSAIWKTEDPHGQVRTLLGIWCGFTQRSPSWGLVLFVAFSAVAELFRKWEVLSPFVTQTSDETFLRNPIQVLAGALLGFVLSKAGGSSNVNNSLIKPFFEKDGGINWSKFISIGLVFVSYLVSLACVGDFDGSYDDSGAFVPKDPPRSEKSVK